MELKLIANDAGAHRERRWQGAVGSSLLHSDGSCICSDNYAAAGTRCVRSYLHDNATCFLDEFHDLIGVSCHRGMARWQRNRPSGLDSFRHPFFGFRRDQPIIRRDLIPRTGTSSN